MTNRTLFSSPLRLLARPSGEEEAPRTPPLFDEPSLFYDPPYDTLVHDAFAWHLVKYLQPGSGLQYHAHRAEWGLDLTVDFVVEQGGQRIGFMCGASPNGAAHDRRCDALRMGRAAVDVLYRLRAEDIEQHLHDVLLLVAKWDADLFSARGRTNLNVLATPEARSVQPRRSDTVLTVLTVRYSAESGGTLALHVQRLSQSHPDGWMPAYEQACNDVGVSLRAAQPWARSA